MLLLRAFMAIACALAFTTAPAFAGGAYDEATFDPDSRLGEQLTHDPGAQFWIPTLDEMIKGAYYDPNRYGPGQEGYWRYPDGGNEPLVSGRPGESGAETSAGVQGDSIGIIPVGAYPDVLSPLGLLDVSGGGQQLTEDLWSGPSIRFPRQTVGSEPGVFSKYEFTHNLGGLKFGLDTLNKQGLRIASAVPAPGGALAVLLLGASVLLKRRR